MPSRSMAAFGCAVLLVSFRLPVLAQDPEIPSQRTVSFQGYLTDDVGTPVNKTVGMKLRTYKIATGESGHIGFTGDVDVVNGRFEVPMYLSETDEVDRELELAITVGTDPESSPRIPLSIVPYAASLRGLHTFIDDNGEGTYAYNILGGVGSTASSTVIGATISGGGRYNVIHETGSYNQVLGDFGTIGGGSGNSAGYYAVVVGGSANDAIGSQSAILGGSSNDAAGTHSTVAGGFSNLAQGSYSFVAGEDAEALHAHSFVWSDGDATFASTGENQFLVAASGGMGLGTNTPITQLRVARSISDAASTQNHVALIDNTSTGTSADVLVLRVARTTNPQTTNSFVTFKFNSTETAGFIQGDGTGGVLFTSLGSDYAEFLPAAADGERFLPGDVVGVHAGEISHDTDGADKVMVVSTSPIVVGNMGAAEDAEMGLGTKVAFVGQAPVRVVGPVNTGDFLLPSGNHDGTAIAVRPSNIRPDQLRSVFATAWETDRGAGMRSVNAAIGIDESTAASVVIENLQHQLNDVSRRLEQLEARTLN